MSFGKTDRSGAADSRNRPEGGISGGGATIRERSWRRRCWRRRSTGRISSGGWRSRGAGDRRRGGDAGGADRRRVRWIWRRRFWADQARVRVERRRKKKLIVAFHFLSRIRPRGDATQCRRQGLEARRRCGWLPEEQRGAAQVVWARGRVATEECPKSLVTPQSLEWVERFLTWKLAGASVNELRAREADAFLTLEREWRDGQQNPLSDVTKLLGGSGANAQSSQLSGQLTTITDQLQQLQTVNQTQIARSSRIRRRWRRTRARRDRAGRPRRNRWAARSKACWDSGWG